MSYAFLQEIPASWQEYRRVIAATLDPVPTGLVLYLAGATDEGVRIFNVWESDEDWKRFRTLRLDPALANLGIAAYAEPRFRDLHAAHVLLGGGQAGASLARPSSPAPPGATPHTSAQDAEEGTIRCES